MDAYFHTDEFLASLIGKIPFGVLVLHEDGRVALANEVAVRHLEIDLAPKPLKPPWLRGVTFPLKPTPLSMRHLLSVMALGLLVALPVSAQDSTRVADSTAAPVAPMPAPVPEAPAPTQTVAELIRADTSLSILGEVLTQAGLMAALEAPSATGSGFTVLAPTNDAFRKLVNLDALRQDQNARQLYDLLMYHVVPGRYLSVHFPQLTTLKSWQGSDVAVAMMGETPMLGGAAHEVGAEVVATNGVLHRIDAVLQMPAAPGAASGE